MTQQLPGSLMTLRWRPDVLPGYSCAELPVEAARLGTEEVDPVATLVRRDPGDGAAGEWAVLYVHGWNDYFFQDHLGDFWAALGYQFFALDLRRYGRSLRPSQLGGYIEDLTDYSELDAAVTAIAAKYPKIVIMAHSTGGLITSLWVQDHPERCAGLILNAPWLDLQGSWLVRALGRPLVEAVSARDATAVIPMPESGYYHRSLWHELDGEWNYNLEWKGNPGPPIRAGWLRAVFRGQARIAKGLNLTVPVLVLCSDKTIFRRSWSEPMTRSDTVLDVSQIAQRSHLLGRSVTLIKLTDALHDVMLSAPAVRAEACVQIARWARGYLAPMPELGESRRDPKAAG